MKINVSTFWNSVLVSLFEEYIDCFDWLTDLSPLSDWHVCTEIWHKREGGYEFPLCLCSVSSLHDKYRCLVWRKTPIKYYMDVLQRALYYFRMTAYWVGNGLPMCCSKKRVSVDPVFIAEHQKHDTGQFWIPEKSVRCPGKTRADVRAVERHGPLVLVKSLCRFEIGWPSLYHITHTEPKPLIRQCQLQTHTMGMEEWELRNELCLGILLYLFIWFYAALCFMHAKSMVHVNVSNAIMSTRQYEFKATCIVYPTSS